MTAMSGLSGLEINLHPVYLGDLGLDLSLMQRLGQELLSIFCLGDFLLNLSSC